MNPDHTDVLSHHSSPACEVYRDTFCLSLIPSAQFYIACNMVAQTIRNTKVVWELGERHSQAWLASFPGLVSLIPRLG